MGRMKITIELSDESAEKLQRYIDAKNAFRAKVADEYESEGNHIVAKSFREILTPEMMVLREVLRAIRDV